MEQYVLIENGLYAGQEARVIKEDGAWLEVVVYGRERKVARSQVRFLPDNYKPFEENKLFEEVVKVCIDGSKIVADGTRAETIKVGKVDQSWKVGGGVFRTGTIKNSEIAGSLIAPKIENPFDSPAKVKPEYRHPIIAIMDNLNKAISKTLSSAKRISPNSLTAQDILRTSERVKLGAIKADEITASRPTGHKEELGALKGKMAIKAVTIPKEDIDNYLEEWKSLDYESENPMGELVKDVVKEYDQKQMAEAAGVIKGLRERSRKQGETHVRLSNRNDQLQIEIKEVQRDMGVVLKDNNHLKTENEFIKNRLEVLKEQAEAHNKRYQHEKKAKFDYIAEVKKGNEYRGKLKETIESLHDEIGQVKQENLKERLHSDSLQKNLDRANRVIDKLTEPGR